MNPISNCSLSVTFKSVLASLLLVPTIANAQSDTVNLIRGGELLFGGLITIFSSNKSEKETSTTVESVCVKNKLTDKITFIITRQTEDGDEIRKELVIQKDSKEFFYELPKGVYTYEVVLANNDVFKKGECRFVDKAVISINGEIIQNPRISRGLYVFNILCSHQRLRGIQLRVLQSFLLRPIYHTMIVTVR